MTIRDGALSTLRNGRAVITAAYHKAAQQLHGE
jgi:hypothetical protein